jgi:hypothetical protein
VDSSKKLAMVVRLLPKVFFGHGEAAFSFSRSGFCLS